MNQAHLSTLHPSVTCPQCRDHACALLKILLPPLGWNSSSFVQLGWGWCDWIYIREVPTEHRLGTVWQCRGNIAKVPERLLLSKPLLPWLQLLLSSCFRSHLSVQVTRSFHISLNLLLSLCWEWVWLTPWYQIASSCHSKAPLTFPIFSAPLQVPLPGPPRGFQVL